MFFEFVLGGDCAVGLLEFVLDQQRPDLIIEFDGFGPLPRQFFVLVVLAGLLLEQPLLVQPKFPVFVEVDELHLLLLRVPVLPSDAFLALIEASEFVLVLDFQFFEFLLVDLDLIDGVEFWVEHEFLQVGLVSTDIGGLGAGVGALGDKADPVVLLAGHLHATTNKLLSSCLLYLLRGTQD